MLQMYHAVMRFSLDKSEQAHVSFRGESQMHNAMKNNLTEIYSIK